MAMNQGRSRPPRHAFRYRAARADGSIVKGVASAPDVESATQWIVAQTWTPLRVAPAFRITRQRRPSRRQLAVAFRSLSNLVAGGVTLERALAGTAALVRGPLSGLLDHVRRRVLDGETLTEAMLRADGAFPLAVVGILVAGERGSRLPDALDEAAEHLEAEAEFLGQLRSALAYPLLVLVVGAVSVVVLGVVVVPRFAELVEGIGGELPAGARLVASGATVLTQWGWLIFSALVALGVAVRASGLTGQYRGALHRVALEIPVVGRIRMSLATARACQALGGMLEAGMPLLDALRIMEDSASDIEVRARLARVEARLRSGESFADALEAEEALDSGAVQLLRLGESSGKLGELAGRAANVVAQDTRRSIHAAVTLIEPLLIVVLGAAVALMAGALLQAVYAVRPV